jgi:hypothetical protein
VSIESIKKLTIEIDDPVVGEVLQLVAARVGNNMRLSEVLERALHLANMYWPTTNGRPSKLRLVSEDCGAIGERCDLFRKKDQANYDPSEKRSQ